MANSDEISARFWNLPWKADEESERENTFIDDIIQKTHIERLITENLDGVETAFDGGAGYGRFSMLLAGRGIRVTHFDISQPMIDKARALAEERGVAGNMTFVLGSLEDLSAFHDAQFDLVMSFDAPISYTYPNQGDVVKNLARIAKKRLIISVYSRMAWPAHAFDPAQKVKYLLDESRDPWNSLGEVSKLAEYKPDMAAVREFFRTGLTEPAESTGAAFEAGGTPWPISYAFMPDELRGLLESCGGRNIRLSGPGALSRLIPGEVLRNIMRDAQLRGDFLDFCYEYDRNPSVAGLGKDNLVALAEIGE
ncbi:MAG: methyltransferase domain-containing protein [Oscillospiraceae bacterium]|jgi:SAM-dependent methyltransferase|nr:methyltransferase domain-containing protein [Oscillospiraceae bacterium]